MKNPTHILVISQYFYPEQFRINDICTEWIKRGYKVTVVTGIPNYPDGKFYKGYGLVKKRKEKYKGIDIIRIPIIQRRSNSISLSLNYLSFVVSGFFWKLVTNVKADYVFNFEVSPMTQALVGVWYSRKHKIPCYLYVQDLWPENVITMTGLTNKFLIEKITNMVLYIYNNCNKIFVTSQSFSNSIVNRGISKEKVIYWPQYSQVIKPLDNKKDRNTKVLNIVFAGNIGYAQGLDKLVNIAEQIKKDNFKLEKRVVFNIIGDGRYKDELVAIVKSKKVSSMFKFYPRQPERIIPELLAKYDIAFLSLADNEIFKMTIPAKLQTYMACGMPILGLASGEVERIIHESNSGFCSPSNDIDCLVNNIIKFSSFSDAQLTKLGDNSYKYYEENFDKEMLLKQMDKFFKLKQET